MFFFTVISMTGAQDLRPIENDISALLEGVGNDILPYLQQTAMAGEGIGRASMGGRFRIFRRSLHRFRLYPRLSHLYR